jgi:tRNA threonylcarbamoyladenosine biosynthesis protein TsaB
MIVAIESSSTDLSLALVAPDGEPRAVDGWSSQLRGAAELLPRLLGLLQANHLPMQGATAFAVGLGPGSFTGLRVGMSLAKGLAFGLGRPIVGIPSLEAWLASEPDATAAMGRAGAREAYLLVRGSSEPRIVDRDDPLPDGRVLAPAELASAFALAGTRPPLRAAATIGRLAAERLAAQPGGDDLARLEPAYLRAPRGIGQVPAAETIQWP